MKKAQVTIFIIVGIAFLAAVGLTIYVVSTTAKQRGEQSVAEQQLAAALSAPVEEYITSCLKLTAEQGVDLLGKQGGVIYDSQGGPAIPSTIQKLSYDGFDVSYGLLAPSTNLAFIRTLPPDYPWVGFPYINPTTKTFLGYFGKNNLLSPGQMVEQLKLYIENNIASCLDFSQFEQKGVSIIPGAAARAVQVTLGNSDVQIYLNWQVQLKNAQGRITAIDKFSATVPVALEKIVLAASKTIDDDRTDSSFVLAPVSRDGINFNIARGLSRNSAMLVFSEPNSKIAGKTFEFRTARQNRIPALHDYYITQSLPACGAKINFTIDNTVHIYNKAGEKVADFKLAATDPDEDSPLTFKLYYEGLTKTQIDAQPFPITPSANKFGAYVTDGIEPDYYTFQLTPCS